MRQLLRETKAFGRPHLNIHKKHIEIREHGHGRTFEDTMAVRTTNAHIYIPL
jgi:hypothetical protein